MRQRTRISTTNGAVLSLDFLPSGSHVVACSELGHLVCANVASGEKVFETDVTESLPDGDEDYLQIAVSHNNGSIAAVDASMGGVAVLDGATGRLCRSILCEASSIFAYDHESETLLMLNERGMRSGWLERITVANTKSGETLLERELPISDQRACGYSALNRQLMIASGAGITCVSAENPLLAHAVHIDCGGVKLLQVSDDGRRAVTVGDDQVVRYWKIAPSSICEQSVHRFSAGADISALHMTRDGAQVLFGLANGSLEVCRFGCVSPLASTGERPAEVACCAIFGQYVVANGWGSAIDIYQFSGHAQA